MSPRPDGSVHVLLVEDNPADANLILEMMEMKGGLRVEFCLADNLYDGARRLAARDIDVILLDLGLPDSQGLTTLRQMRAQAPGIPIVVMTGWDDDEIVPWALQAGAQAYLVKGKIDERSLTGAIREAAGFGPGQDPGSATS